MKAGTAGSGAAMPGSPDPDSARKADVDPRGPGERGFVGGGVNPNTRRTAGREQHGKEAEGLLDHSSSTASTQEQDKLVRDILIRGSAQPTDVTNVVEQAIRDPLRISTALGASMLPRLPILNALVAAIIAIPSEEFVSSEAKA